MKFRNFQKNNILLFIVVLAAIIFTIATSSFNHLTQSYSPAGDFVKWGSPDETANYIFTKLYGQEGRISFEEGYNRYTNDVMRPRSFRSDWGNLKPVSFLGIILIFGQIVGWTSYKVLPFLTPITAGLGLIFFYLLVKQVWGKPNAFISALLLAVFPPYIYFSVRSMFHNVLFTVMLVMALYFVVLLIKKKGVRRPHYAKATRGKQVSGFRFKAILDKLSDWFKRPFKNTDWLGMLWAAVGGSFLGLAVMTRTSELLWLAPLFLLLWLFNIRRIGLVKLLVFLAFAFLAILPMLYQNTILYSSPILGGYSEMNNSIVSIKDAGTEVIRGENSGVKFLNTLSDKIFHFGFDWKQSLKMVKYYFIDMFPAYWWLMMGGFILFILNLKNRRLREWQWLIAGGIISIILVLYYGSWEFFDNPDTSAHTIGNSYTRYWLPMYLYALPLAAFFLLALTRNISELWAKLNRAWFRWSLRILTVIVIGIFSINFVLAGSEEGLLNLFKQQKEAKQTHQRILELTEPNATVITRYHDKLLFPERKVIVGLFDDQNMNAIYARLLNYLPVYYYNFTLPEEDLNYLNQRRLAEVGVGIELVEEVGEGFGLYKLYLVDNKVGENL